MPIAPIRHVAFFRAAGAYAEESVEYRTLLAGLLVLRLLDKRRWRAGSDRLVDFRESLAVKRAVAALPDQPVRRILDDLVCGLSTFTRTTTGAHAAKLIAYAQMLEINREWEPAADVYQSAIDVIAFHPGNRDLLPTCYAGAQFCLRQAGVQDRIAALPVS